MTKEELAGVVRAIAAAKGWLPGIDDATKELLLAAVSTALVAAWSVKAKRAK
jgi:hypothetical protein